MLSVSALIFFTTMVTSVDVTLVAAGFAALTTAATITCLSPNINIPAKFRGAACGVTLVVLSISGLIALFKGVFGRDFHAHTGFDIHDSLNCTDRVALKCLSDHHKGEPIHFATNRIDNTYHMFYHKTAGMHRIAVRQLDNTVSKRFEDGGDQVYKKANGEAGGESDQDQYAKEVADDGEYAHSDDFVGLFNNSKYNRHFKTCIAVYASDTNARRAITIDAVFNDKKPFTDSREQDDVSDCQSMFSNNDKIIESINNGTSSVYPDSRRSIIISRLTAGLA